MTAKKRGIVSVLLSLLILSAVTLASCMPLNPDMPGKDTGTEAPAISADISSMDFDVPDDLIFTDYDVNASVLVALSDGGSSVTVPDGVAGTVKTDGADVTVTAAGTYILTGKATDARVTVDAGKDADVLLVLAGVDLACSDGPVIYVREAGKVTLSTAENTENTVSDGKNYTFTDNNVTLDGAIFSRRALVINGNGTLTVKGQYKHGIVSKDALTVAGGTLNVCSVNVALCGKDSVRVSGGTVTLDAGTDGIRSDNITDSALGFVGISGGDVKITSASDGIQAATVLKISGGTINLLTGGGSGNVSSSGGSFTPGQGFDPGRTPGGSRPGGPGGDPGRDPGANPGVVPGGDPSGTVPSDLTETTAKGLKAGAELIIEDGVVSVDSADDCLHSDGTMTVSGGTINLKSGDDGAHANTKLTVSGGTLDIVKSYEGIESADILISGGTISIVASDDGINAAGGKDSSSVGGRQGMGSFSRSTGAVTISGGYVFVNASGDGIDSNGTITVSGGITLVSGPTDNGNSAFDYEKTASVTGGILVALGSSGMAQGFTSATGQGAMLVNFTTQKAGTTFAVTDADGKVIASFTSPKQFASATVTSPEIQVGKTYTLVAGGTVSGADANGFTSDGSVSGGTTLATVNMTKATYSSGGGGMNPFGR